MTVKVNLNGIHELDFNGATAALTGPGIVTITASATAGTGAVGVTVDGGASVPGTGIKGYLKVPYNCTIIGWTIMANQSGSAVFDVKYATSVSGIGSTTSLTGTAQPTLSGAQAIDSTTLTGWMVTLTSGMLLEFDLTSVLSVTRVTLELTLQKT